MPYNSRADWGAQAPRGSLSRWAASPYGIAVHYVGGAGSIGLAGKDHSACLQMMRNLQSYAFRGGNGWTYSDLEYNLAVCPHGFVIEARGLAWQGAAQKGANSTHVSICALANVGDGVTGGLAAGLNDAIATVQHSFPSARQVVGHRDTAGNPTGTNCPGNFIEDWLHSAHGTGSVPGASPVPHPPASSGPPVLTTGSRGDAVRLLQQLLINHGAKISLDGSFGPATKSAVIAFQRSHGLGGDGIVGPKTWAALTTAGGNQPVPAPAPAIPHPQPTIRKGSNGQAVRVAQEALNRKLRTRLVVDGNFGNATDAATRQFQTNIRNFFHLPHFVVDGIIGPATWYWLLA